MKIERGGRLSYKFHSPLVSHRRNILQHTSSFAPELFSLPSNAFHFFFFFVISFVSVYFRFLLAQASVCLSREIVGGTLEFCADGPPVLPKKIWPVFFSLFVSTNFISLVTILEFGYGVFD